MRLATHGGLPALQSADLSWDYAELAGRVAERARQLQQTGLQPGQVVMVPTRPAVQLELMRHALERCGAALLPVAAKLEPARQQRLLELASVEWRWQVDAAGDGHLQATSLQPPVHSEQLPRLTALVTTSGSGGQPKLVMLSPANIQASAAWTNRVLELEPGDTWLCCLPREHIGGLIIGYRCALAGARLLSHDGFAVDAVRQALDAQAVTHLSLVPPMLARLLTDEVMPPPSLRAVLIGGQALDAALAARAIEAGWPLRVTYGMTETTSHIAMSGRLTAPPPAGMIGALGPGVTVACPTCGHGDEVIEVRGAPVMAGYANPNRALGQGLTADGWLTTNDRGCLTASGDLQIAGRADEALIIGGHTVWPSEIERRLADCAEIGECAVVGLAEPTWGYCLGLAYTGEAEPAAIEAWCRAHLPSQHRPRRFCQVNTLPMLSSGKIDRPGVQALLCHGPYNV